MEEVANDAAPMVSYKRLERKHEAKKWEQLYNNSVRNVLEMRNLKIQMRREERMRMFRDDDDDQSVYSMATLSVHTNINRTFLTTGDPKAKAIAKLGNKKVADVLLETPPSLPVWHSHWGNQLLCYVCSQPALHNSVSCGSCNNIAHVQCVEEISRENSDAERSCLHCLEQYYLDKRAYEERLRKFKEELMRNHCASIIGRRIKVFLERRRFLRKQAAVRKLQAIVRGSIYFKRFYKQMRGKLRLVLLQVNPRYDVDHINPEFLNNVLVVITVFDPHKNVQSFRLERAYRSLSETAVTLAGVNYFMSVIFTIAVRDETKAYLILGQTQFSLGDILRPAHPASMSLQLTPRITWMPQDCFGIKFAHLVTTGRVNNTLRHFRQEVSFHVRYLPQNPVTTSCQYIHGPPLDVLRRGGDMNRLPKHRAAAGNSNNNNNNQHHNNSDGGSSHMLVDNHSSGLHLLATSLNDLVRDRPPSPVIFDSLHKQNAPPSNKKFSRSRHKKNANLPGSLSNDANNGHSRNNNNTNSNSNSAATSAAAIAAAQSAGNYRASQYWMVLYNLRLLFYQFHGDIEPRFSLELADVNVILSKEMGRTYCMVSLQFSDGRIWHLEFNDRKSAVLFDIAVHESKKALRENNSLYMRQDDFNDDVSIGFR